MEQLITFALKEWPDFAKYLVLVTMLILLIAIPFAVVYWILGLKNRHRFIFANSNNYLYRMDSYNGRIHKAHGDVFIEIEFITKKDFDAKKR